MRIPCLAALLCWLSACASLHDEHEREIPLADVPAAARAAAEQAVPGIRLVEAEVDEEHGRLVYVLEGIVNGREYEIEVTPEGEVLEIEEEGPADEDDDEDDEGDDGEDDD
jgi:hypothetical protein